MHTGSKSLVCKCRSTSHDQLKIPLLPAQVLHVFKGCHIAEPKVPTFLTIPCLKLYRMFQNGFAMLEVVVLLDDAVLEAESAVSELHAMLLTCL